MGFIWSCYVCLKESWKSVLRVFLGTQGAAVSSRTREGIVGRNRESRRWGTVLGYWHGLHIAGGQVAGS